MIAKIKFPNEMVKETAFMKHCGNFLEKLQHFKTSNYLNFKLTGKETNFQKQNVQKSKKEYLNSKEIKIKLRYFSQKNQIHSLLLHLFP